MEKPPPSERREGPPPPETQFMSVFGMSNDAVKTLIKAMRRVVERVGCPAHIDPLEVVHDAFVLALHKPIAERPAIREEKKFVAWMCEITKFAALTNLKSKHTALLATQPEELDLGSLLFTAGTGDNFVTRDKLHEAMQTLDAEEQVLLRAHYFEGKTIHEIALEQHRPWSTISSRRDRLLRTLRTALGIKVAAFIVSFTKNAHAHATRLLRYGTRLAHQTMHVACAMTVTVACGVMVPASSTAATETKTPNTLSHSAMLPPLKFALHEDHARVEEVAPVKRDELDKPVPEWSAADMKSPKFATYIQSSLMPFAFLVMPAVTQVACAGAGQNGQPSGSYEPDEADNSGGHDPYEMMCTKTRARGAPCPTRAEWYGDMGRCPDGTHDCQKK